MVVGGKLLALLLPFSLLLSLAYSATYTLTAATCFATLGSASVGSTTFAARRSGTRLYYRLLYFLKVRRRHDGHIARMD